VYRDDAAFVSVYSFHSAEELYLLDYSIAFQLVLWKYLIEAWQLAWTLLQVLSFLWAS